MALHDYARFQKKKAGVKGEKNEKKKSGAPKEELNF